MTGRRLVPEEIAKLLATPKRVKSANMDLLMTARNRAMMLHQARNFVSGMEKSPLAKFAIGTYNAPYAAKVFGHAAALHGTHAWTYALDPKMWPAYGRTWVNSWKASFPLKGFTKAEANAKAVAQDIMLSPTFDEQIRSGLAADPRRMYDDLQQQVGFWGKLGRMAGNSFLGLKQLRSRGWDTIWNTVPEHLKTDEMRSLISVDVNHMTGAPGPKAAQAMTGPIGKGLRALAFAPSLDIARISRPVDLVKWAGVELKTAMNRAPIIGDQLARAWGRASPEEQWFANYKMKQYLRMASVATGILFMNQMVLKHIFGSDENINVSDFDQPDWLAVKGPDGSILQATGGQVSMGRAVMRSVAHPGQAPQVMGNYLMNKLNPFLALGANVMKGKVFGGADIPFPLGEGAPTVGNWAEFLFSELGPISTEDGIHHFAQEMSNQNGVPVEFHEKFLTALLKAGLVAIPAVLGAHYYQPTTTPRSSRGSKSKAPLISQ
jgi:hypothetical protein